MLSFLKSPRRITGRKLAAKAAQRKSQFGALSRLPNFLLAMETVNDLGGAIVEAGVGSGLSLAHLWLASRVLCPDRAIVAIDSFESFPESYTSNRVSKPSRGVSLFDHVCDNLRIAGIDPSSITFLKGYFAETLSQYPKLPIALLHIDVDLGKSYTDVLTALWPFVVSGGVIVFDEYGSPTDLRKWPDAKPAIDAFMADKQFEVIARPWTSRRMVKKL